MDLYLFPALDLDEVIRQLLGLREGKAPRRGLYPELFEFVCRRAYTLETVREYVLRKMLQNPPPHWQGEVMRPYLTQDVKTVYDLFFDADWDALCAAAGVLPIPRGILLDAPGEKAYKDIVTQMAAAAADGALTEMIAGFFTRYRDEEEAMYRAFRWNGSLHGVLSPDPISFDDLYGLDYQKQTIIDNTRSFVNGLPANDILLFGGGGSGKSSCVKAALNHFSGSGLKLAEFSNNSLTQLPALIERLSRQTQKYIVFIDDISFENADENYLSLKVALDGQVAKRPDNVLIYATSNRRHLIRESWKDRERDEELHLNDTISEKKSLSERFGIRLYFPSPEQSEYLGIIGMLFEKSGMVFTEEVKKEAVAWATAHNGRSGRTARQFVKHYYSRCRA